MKILFLTEYFYPHCDANGNCVWNLAKAMVNSGHTVSVLCNCTREEDRVQKMIDGIRVYGCCFDSGYTKSEAIKLMSQNFFSGLILFVRALVRRVQLQFLAGFHVRPYRFFKVKSALKLLLQQETFDAVVATFFPVDFGLICAQLTKFRKMQTPFYLYQVDLYITNTTLSRHFQWLRIKVLQFIYKQSAGAIITLQMREEMNKLTEIDNKVIIEQEFPCFNPTRNNKNCFAEKSSSVIQCVYAGTLYDDIRNPDYTFSLFEALGKQISLQFHVYSNYSPSLCENKYHHIIFHEKVSAKEYDDILSAANILVHIGNSTCTQLPSKLLDFLSTGRPIVNIIKNSACPTISYAQKYPFCLTILENFPHFQEQTKIIKRFILENAKKSSLNAQTLVELYQTCTPEYVSAQFVKIMQPNKTIIIDKSGD